MVFNGTLMGTLETIIFISSYFLPLPMYSEEHN